METDFYEQYEFSLVGVPLPPALRYLTQRPFLDDVRAQVEQIFSVRLSERIDCTAHRAGSRATDPDSQ